jgi:hypothetical protein
LIADEILSSSGRAETREGVRSIVQGAKLDEIKGKALDALKETAEIVDQTAPGEAAALNGGRAQISKTLRRRAPRAAFSVLAG